MFLVVVNTPEGRSELGPFNTMQEALWRRDYEHRCAEYLFGGEARPDIGARIEAMPVRPLRGHGKRKAARRYIGNMQHA